MNYLQSLEKIRDKIKHACQRKGLDFNLVKIIAVSKQFPATIINDYLAQAKQLFDLPLIGENKTQEVVEKKPQLIHPHLCHFIGHLQTNKINKTIPLIDLLHSLDRIELAEKIHYHLEQNQRELDCLVQINTSQEESKFGCDPSQVFSLVERCLSLTKIRLKGLMTMAPFTDDSAVIRKCFADLREWREKINKKFDINLVELSMGMSNDYEVAVEEGSTMVRIGTAIFGERIKK